VTDTIVPLRPRTRPEGHDARGRARCTGCGHEWDAVTEVPQFTPWIGCPSCGADRAIYLGPYAPREGVHVFRCQCGSDLLHVTAEGLFCPGCGREPDFGSLDV